jgi:hypothetical protein
MNLPSIVLLVIILICLALAVRYLIRHPGESCGGCSGDCRHCKHSCHKGPKK